MKDSTETWQLNGQAIQVSHLGKNYWAQAGFTKGDMLEYYRQIAPVALPHFKDRPVTLRVYPRGVDDASYYLRDYPADAPAAHPTVSTPLTWEELAAGTIQPTDLTPPVIFERIGRLGDLFAPLLQRDQHIP